MTIIENLRRCCIAAFALVCVSGCDAFTPNIDPGAYPCGDPRAHYCGRSDACCLDGWDCAPEYPGCPAGECCFYGPEGARRSPALRRGAGDAGP